MYFVNLLIILLVSQSIARDNLEEWTRTVVYLEAFSGSNRTIANTGTGFLLWDYTTSGKDLILVTNQHVLHDKDSLSVRLNLIPNELKFETLEAIVPLKTPRGLTWRALSPDIDVAAMRVVLPLLDSTIVLETISIGNSMILPRDSLLVGEDVLYLGFPIGISGNLRNTPVLRRGLVSLTKSDELANGTFLVEAQALPGNSGGPVFRREYVMFDSSQVVQVRSGLIGIMTAYKPTLETYYDQNLQPRIALSVHSGLSIVYDTDIVMKCVSLVRQ